MKKEEKERRKGTQTFMQRKTKTINLKRRKFCVTFFKTLFVTIEERKIFKKNK